MAKKRQNKKRKLNLQHKLFIDNLTNIDNPKTFNNATQSYAAAYPMSTIQAAGPSGCDLLKNPMIKTSIEQIISDMELGPKVRLKAIKRVLSGDHKQTTVTTSKDRDGNVYTATSIKSPTASDTLKAVDVLNKTDGTYDKNRAKADVMSSELKSLLRRHRKELTGTRGGGNDATVTN